MEQFNAILQGVLVGGLYALFAAGLSLIFGVMRLVNISHGDLIVAAAYLSWTAVQVTGLHPLLCVIFAVPIAAAFGYMVQRGILNRTLGKDILPPLLVTFGLSVIIQNGLLQSFSADSRKLDAGWLETKSFELLPGIAVGLFPVLIFAAAVATIWALQHMFYKTKLGRAFRATSDDPEIAQLMGLVGVGLLLMLPLGNSPAWAVATWAFTGRRSVVRASQVWAASLFRYSTTFRYCARLASLSSIRG